MGAAIPGGHRQHREYLADAVLLGCGLGQRKVRLDLITVTAAVLLLDDIARLRQVSHDAEGAALGDPHRGSNIAQAHPRVTCHAQQHPGVIGQERPLPHLSYCNTILETSCYFLSPGLEAVRTDADAYMGS